MTDCKTDVALRYILRELNRDITFLENNTTPWCIFNHSNEFEIDETDVSAMQDILIRKHVIPELISQLKALKIQTVEKLEE